MTGHLYGKTALSYCSTHKADKMAQSGHNCCRPDTVKAMYNEAPGKLSGIELQLTAVEMIMLVASTVLVAAGAMQ
jgi:hypothetical protein